MSSLFRKYAKTLLLLCILSLATTIHSQQHKAPDRTPLITAAREIMAAARYCALITLDSSGRAQARAMDPFLPDDDMVVWFGTNPKSRKVREIRRNPRVVIYYFDAKEQDYVTVSGIARLVDDPNEKARHWKDEWKAFYPDREKHYLLIAVTPEKLEVVSDKRSIVGDPNTWVPQSIKFSTNPRYKLRRARPALTSNTTRVEEIYGQGSKYN